MLGTLFALIYIVVMAVPVLGILWSTYVLMEWRGAWRLAASIPLVISIAGFFFYEWSVVFDRPTHGSFGGWVLGGDLCILPYMLFAWLMYRGLANAENQADGRGTRA